MWTLNQLAGVSVGLTELDGVQAEGTVMYCRVRPRLGLSCLSRFMRRVSQPILAHSCAVEVGGKG